LFFATHGMIAELLHTLKSSPGQPVMQAGAGGDEPGAWDLGIGVRRKEGHGLAPGNGLGLDDQVSSGLERTKQVTQRLYRRRTMIEDAEAEYYIETFGEEVEMFDTEQFRLQLGLAGKGVEGVEGKVMLDIGLESQDKFRLVMSHAEHVISVVATDIGDNLASEFGQLGNDPVPFSLASPFGVDVDTEDGKWAFAPRHKTPEHRFYPLVIAGRQFVGTADADDVSGEITG